MSHRTHRIRRTRRLALIGLAAAALLISSCGSPTDNDTRSATAGLPDTLQSLQANTWVLDGAASTPAIDPKAEITLTFEEDRLSGQAPCNAYGADFSVEGDAGLEIDHILSTMAACEQLDAEQAYLQALGTIDTADTTDPTRLVLEGDGVSLEFGRAPGEAP